MPPQNQKSHMLMLKRIILGRGGFLSLCKKCPMSSDKKTFDKKLQYYATRFLGRIVNFKLRQLQKKGNCWEDIKGGIRNIFACFNGVVEFFTAVFMGF